MEKYDYFVGIDISKGSLDFCARDFSGIRARFSVANSRQGLAGAQSLLRGLPGFIAGRALFCMEHTGIYSAIALRFLHLRGAGVWLESAAAIRNGGGAIQRGKSDRMDAARIAEYAFVFRHRVRLWEPPREVLGLLADLMAERSRLLKVVHMLGVPLGETRRFRPGRHAALAACCRRTARAAKEELSGINRRIREAIRADERLKSLFARAVSVPGVGFVTAVAMIVSTNEFRSITDPRKFACHAGCAPFEHSSGTSLRAGPRVSHRADKSLKALLNCGATSAVRFPGELKDYFDRKLAQGKNRWLVLNNVRNKMIHRVFAAVRDGRPYQKNVPQPLTSP